MGACNSTDHRSCLPDIMDLPKAMDFPRTISLQAAIQQSAEDNNTGSSKTLRVRTKEALRKLRIAANATDAEQHPYGISTARGETTSKLNSLLLKMASRPQLTIADFEGVRQEIEWMQAVNTQQKEEFTSEGHSNDYLDKLDQTKEACDTAYNVLEQFLQETFPNEVQGT